MLIWNYKLCEHNQWFGSGIFELNLAFQYCQMKGYFLTTSEDDNWHMVPNTQKSRNWTYYFENLTISDEHKNLPQENAKFRQAHDRTDSWFPVDKFSSLFNYRKYIMKKIFKPKEWVNNLVKEKIDKLGIKNSYYAIHIRRTDKVNDEGIYHSVDEYLRPLYNYLVSTNNLNEIKQVYISTDEDKSRLYVELKNSQFSDFFNFVLDYSETTLQHGFVPNAHNVLGRGLPLDSNFVQGEMITAFKNIYLLSNAEYLVGSRESFFFIIAMLLSEKPWYSLAENIKYEIFDGIKPIIHKTH
jgi:hypothetical protein